MPIFLIVLGLLFGAPAFAAVTPNSPITAQTPNRGIVQFLQGTDSAGTYKTIYTAGSNGSICKALFMSTDDGTATHLMNIQIVNAAVKYGGTALTTVLSAGFTTANPPQNLMSSAVWPGLPLDQNGNPTLTLISGDTLQATFATALTASTRVNIVAQCSDY